MFRSALLRREGVRGFGFGIGCSRVIQMTRDGHRQVGIGRIGVCTVTVVTYILAIFALGRLPWLGYDEHIFAALDDYLVVKFAGDMYKII